SIPRSPKIRTVVTIYDLMLEIFPEYSKVVASRDHRQYRRGVEQFASAAICISDNTRNDLLSRWQVSPSKAHTVLLGLPPAATRGSDDAQREIGDYMLSPFNLEPRKNLATLLGAFKRFQSSSDRFKLVLFGRAGHNEQREREFWERASTLGIKAAVHLTGIVSDKELYGLYHGAKAFVFPSLYEGFGLPVLEAMRCGCPVIVHGGSAMQEIAGDAGICVDANDEKQLNAAMERLTNNPSDAKILARRALERSATFTAERMARETLEVYRSVLESR
ncbi:MAG: glycosyltransferase family 4 protein, partial [Gemmatimonadales bacterium]